MTHTLVKTIRSYTLSALFILGFAATTRAAAPINQVTPETIQQAMDAVDTGNRSITIQGIVDCINQNMHDASLAEKLFQRAPGYPTYLRLLYERTDWRQWEIIAPWFKGLTPQTQFIEGYVDNIYYFSRYIPSADLVQKVIDASAKDTILLTTLTKNPTLTNTMYSLANSQQKTAISKWFEYNEVTIETLEKTINALSSYSYSYVQYNKIGTIEKIIEFLTQNKQNPATLEKLTAGASLLDTLYQNANTSQQAFLKELAKNAYEFKTGQKLKQSITQLILLTNLIPGWAYSADGWTNIKQTQTKPHFFENASSTFALLRNCSGEMRRALVAVYKKEQAERAKGNYVFYHAQRWDLHLSADIYKQLWNITKGDSVGDDFTFFRFNQQAQATSNRMDYLFMNHALFGNSRRSGSCTVGYFMQNSSIYLAWFPAERLCNDFKLSQYYTKYRADFEKLTQLHQQANTTGNLMLISIPADKLHLVRPVHPGGDPRTVTINGRGTSDTKTILDTLISSPKAITDSDDIEYTMPLTTKYVLDPHSGPRVYSFNAADPIKMQAYETLRDELFAKIKQDMHTHKQ